MDYPYFFGVYGWEGCMWGRGWTAGGEGRGEEENKKKGGWVELKTCKIYEKYSILMYKFPYFNLTTDCTDTAHHSCKM